nr:immunoglobulin light chain junction region [Macaca mulatta]
DYYCHVWDSSSAHVLL